MLALLWLLWVCFGIVSGALGPMVTPILADLDITYTQMGFILGSWPLVYIGVAFMAGVAIDIIGLRWALFFGALIVGLSSVLRIFATDFETMLLFVAMFGLGGPMISVGAPKMLSLWFRGKDQAVATGIASTGPRLGTIIAFSTANSLMVPLTGGWGMTFVGYGVVALAAAILWVLLARDPPGGAQSDGESGGGGPVSTGSVLRRLVGIRNVRLILAMGMVSFLITHTFNAWLPQILESYGKSASGAGFWAAASGAIGLVALLIIPPLVPTRWRTHALSLLFLGTGVGSLVVGTASGLGLSLGLALLGICRGAMAPMLMLTLIRASGVGPRFMGAAGGLYFTMGEIGGVAGPLAMGYLQDRTGSFLSGLGLVGGLCTVAALLAMSLEAPSGEGEG